MRDTELNSAVYITVLFGSYTGKGNLLFGWRLLLRKDSKRAFKVIIPIRQI